MNAFDLCATISLNTEKYEAGLKDAKKKAQNLAITDFGESYTNGFEKVAKTAIKVGTVVGGALTAIGGYAVKVGSDFEAGMSEVKAISGATETQMAMLEKQAAELGKTTKFSASEAAEGYKYMAMAGWDAKDMLDGLPGVLNLAAASGENLGTVSDIVTDALTAMGLKAKDSAHFSDVLAAAASNSNTNVSMMGQTFKYAAPLAGALKFSIEDLAIATGLMANAGIKESQAGTALRSTLTRLAKPPKECAEAMDAYNISMTDSEGNMKSLYDVMGNLRKSLGKLPEQEQAAAAAAIGGQEAMSGLLAIINASDKDFAKLTEAVYDSNGAAETMAKTMQDNLQGKIVILKSALEAVGVSAYKKFEEPLKNAVDKVTEAINIFDMDAFIEKGKNIFSIIERYSPVLTGIGTALGVLYGYFKAKKFIDQTIKSVKLLNAAMKANPILFIVALIAGLIAALVHLYNTNENFRNAVNNAWDAIKTTVSAAANAIAKFFTETIPSGIQATIDWFSNLPTRISEFLQNTIESINEWAIETAESAKTGAKTFLDNVILFFSDLPYNVGYFLGATARYILDWAAQMIENGKNASLGFLNAVIEFFVQLPVNVQNFLTMVITSVILWAIQFVENARQAASDFFDSVVEWLEQLPDKVMEWLSNAANKVIEWGTTLIENGTKAAEDLVNAVMDGLSGLPGKIFDLGKEAAKSLLDGIKSMGDWIKGQLSSFVDGLTAGFSHSHAGGLDYVPYNNYSANLHRGEMVLTADEADKYRRGQRANNGFTVNQTIYAAKQTPVELAASTAAYFQQARWAL